MTSVNIKLDDKELLHYFNQIHAAIREAHSAYIEADAFHEEDKGVIRGGTSRASLTYRKANAKLIASLQSVIQEIQTATALDVQKKSRFWKD